ncbi:Uncharacterised protein [Nocardia otitidiscaviarum]|uniref:Uncharacterized protein n=1 Tax=Nocardia otitidiscaviarum TaxID=1823 RepID=A0A378YA67_9NOCA|nr:Uncharacterised protein [Nocardia otitidiscaviarum]
MLFIAGDTGVAGMLLKLLQSMCTISAGGAAGSCNWGA